VISQIKCDRWWKPTVGIVRYKLMQIFLPENLREWDHQSVLSLVASIIFTRNLKEIFKWNALIYPSFWIVSQLLCTGQ